MKITRRQLRKIIKEELSRTLNEDKSTPIPVMEREWLDFYADGDPPIGVKMTVGKYIGGLGTRSAFGPNDFLSKAIGQENLAGSARRRFLMNFLGVDTPEAVMGIGSPGLPHEVFMRLDLKNPKILQLAAAAYDEDNAGGKLDAYVSRTFKNMYVPKTP